MVLEEKLHIIIMIFVPYFRSLSPVTISLPKLVSSICKQPKEPRPAIVDGTLLRLDIERAYIKRIKILAILAKMQLALDFDPGRDIRGDADRVSFRVLPSLS